jgi:hypothetical protein
VAHARTRHDSHAVPAIDQPRDDRHDERDVAAALKHREEDSGWLCHLRLVGSVSGLLLTLWA